VLLLVLLPPIGILWVVADLLRRTPFERGKNPDWWFTAAGSMLVAVGLIGFFAGHVAAVGGLNWLPASFEWPVGNVDGVVRTSDGLNIVPHQYASRIQVYDDEWRFRRGWQLDSGGGLLKLFVTDPFHVHAVTARGEWHYVFDLEGRVVSKQSYAPASFDSFPDLGRAANVPTSPWGWVFSRPFYALFVGFVGMATLGLVQFFRPDETREAVPAKK
jgi:hypothetical protein